MRKLVVCVFPVALSLCLTGCLSNVKGEMNSGTGSAVVEVSAYSEEGSTKRLELKNGRHLSEYELYHIAEYLNELVPKKTDECLKLSICSALNRLESDEFPDSVQELFPLNDTEIDYEDFDNNKIVWLINVEVQQRTNDKVFLINGEAKEYQNAEVITEEDGVLFYTIANG